jgi:hypothetical protein
MIVAMIEGTSPKALIALGIIIHKKNVTCWGNGFMSQKAVENVVFFLDVHSKYLSKGDIVKNVRYFIDEKSKLPNTQSIFSAFLFTEGNTPVFHAEKSGKELGKLIEKDWNLREKKESSFENGLFYCLSYLAEKAVANPGTFRIVVITDLPSNKNSEYTDALMTLTETVRMFPTFIDIIRIGQERFYKDDVKLRVITTICSGTVSYIQSAKKLQSTLMGLVKNKTLPEIIVGQSQVIDPHQKKYYENLSKSLIPLAAGEKGVCQLCKLATCAYCNDEADILMKCPKCNTTYHECCSALYSWRTNIGLKHIFRCVTCGVLLCLDEAKTYRINGQPMPGQEPDEAEASQVDSSEETWTPPEESSENPNVESVPRTPGTPFVRMKPRSTSGQPKPKAAPVTPNAPSPLAARQRKSGTNRVIFCPICSEVNKNGERKCKKCNTPL